MRISDWSSDVCSSDLPPTVLPPGKHQVVSPYNDAEKSTAKSTGGALLEETKMREMTDGELAGAAEITDDMLVLGNLTDLPPPGDEAAAIAFVSSMIERALVPPAEPSSSSLIQRSEERCVGTECVSTLKSGWSQDT